MIVRVVPRRDRSLWATLKVHPDVRVRAGKIAWRASRSPAMCVLVRDGALVLRDGAGEAVGVAGAGDLVGLGVGDGDGGSTSAVLADGLALRDSHVAPVPRDRVEGALRRSATTLRVVLESLHRGSALARSLGGGAGRATAAVRLARVVREAAERVGEERSDGGRTVDDVSHRILSEWAGLHRSTVTTLLNEWIYDGTLGQRGRAIVVPPSGKLPGEAPAKR